MFDISLIRDEFPILEDIVYMDSASTSLTPNCVVDKMCEYYREYNANIGRGAYGISIRAGEAVENARKLIGNFINSESSEIVFTKNTTEGVNIVAGGLEFKDGENVIVSNIEHHSNLVPWLNLRGVETRILKADSSGIVNPEDLYSLIDYNTRLVSIGHINNAIGSVQDVKRVCEIGREFDVLSMVDGAQSIGHIPVDVKSIGADFMSFPGHKGLMGPTGTGFLYVNCEKSELLSPKCLGGGTVSSVSEDGFVLEEFPHCFEGGTLNISGIIGLGEAVEYINRLGISNIEKYTGNLTKSLYDGLSSISGVTVYGERDNISNIVSFNVSGMNPHDVSKILDETSNICVRSGHHCAIPSLNLLNAYDGSVRASLHCYNSLDEVELLIDCIEGICELR